MSRPIPPLKPGDALAGILLWLGMMLGFGVVSGIIFLIVEALS